MFSPFDIPGPLEVVSDDDRALWHSQSTIRVQMDSITRWLASNRYASTKDFLMPTGMPIQAIDYLQNLFAAKGWQVQRPRPMTLRFVITPINP